MCLASYSRKADTVVSLTMIGGTGAYLALPFDGPSRGVRSSTFGGPFSS